MGLFPKHECYCEVFGGSAAILLSKPPSEMECYNDIDARLVNFWRVLREHLELPRWRNDDHPLRRRADLPRQPR